MTIQITDNFNCEVATDVYEKVYEIDGRFHGKFTVESKTILDTGIKYEDSIFVYRRAIIKR